MTKRRVSILVMMAFSSGLALLWGFALARSARGTILDYRVVYVGARCLLLHCDPYNQSELMRVYLAEGGEQVAAAKSGQTIQYLAAVQLYPPTAELLFVPFAFLPWPISYAVWVGLIFVSTTTAAYLMWDVGQEFSPDPPFYLACILLVNSGILFSSANPAGISVAFCVIGVWCILRRRHLLLGVICMAVSLAVKPHDSAFIWLYLFLLGGQIRKQAIQSMLVVGIFAVLAVVWMSQVAPHWFSETITNLADYSSQNSYNDPAGSTASMMVNLQPVLATFHNDPRFYNLSTYAICAPLFILLALVAIRGNQTPTRIWLGLAAMATLSLLPIYHRPHDAKILLLTLPACAALWAKGGRIAWAAISFTAAGILITSDLPLGALAMVNSSLEWKSGLANHLLFLALSRPAGLVILAMGIFYVGVYFTYQIDEKAEVADPLQC
jgi:hypothetical protein